MTRTIYILPLALPFLIAAAIIFKKDEASSTPLSKIHQEIISDYPNMSHISRAELENHLTSAGLLILDTRPIKEYNVSHIEGALQVDPDIGPEAFRTKFGKLLKNKKVVIYCSVGRRSSILGDRLHSTALTAGAISIHTWKAAYLDGTMIIAPW